MQERKESDKMVSYQIFLRKLHPLARIVFMKIFPIYFIKKESEKRAMIHIHPLNPSMPLGLDKGVERLEGLLSLLQ